MRFIIFMISFLLVVSSPQAHANPIDNMEGMSAVILAYNRIGEDNYPQTSLRQSDFETHINELTNGSYNVLPLSEIISSLKSNAPLPPKTVAITFEGGYKSALKYAIPQLLERKLPCTVFFSSNNGNKETNEYMDWRDIKSLKRHKNVSFGILPASYTRVTELNSIENKRLLNKARIDYRDHLKQEATFFSYPFGQYDERYKDVIKDQGFNAAFGLQSGVAYNSMDFYNVPRFTLTDGFGDIERFRMLVNALPIPAIDIQPENHVIKDSEPLFGFSVPQKYNDILNSVSCFISGLGKAKLEKIGNNRIEIRPPHALENGRVRINCTANTGTQDIPQWHWFGMLYTIDNQSDYERPKNNQQGVLLQPQE